MQPLQRIMVIMFYLLFIFLSYPQLFNPYLRSAGEISCTVEETNRIRTTLGLKPLTMGMSWESKEKAAIDNYQAQSDKEKKVRCIEDIKERIEKTKEKRIDRAPIKGVGLADVNAVTDTNILSTVRWVMSTRSKQVSHKQ